MRILVAVDFGLYGKAQCSMIKRVASRDAQVKIVHVMEPLSWELQTGYHSSMPMSDAFIEDRRAASRKLLEDIATQIKDSTDVAEIAIELREGNVPGEILSAAEDFKADLLLVGSHGRVGLERFLLGSVSNNIASHAKCSVLICRLST